MEDGIPLGILDKQWVQETLVAPVDAEFSVWVKTESGCKPRGSSHCGGICKNSSIRPWNPRGREAKISRHVGCGGRLVISTCSGRLLVSSSGFVAEIVCAGVGGGGGMCAQPIPSHNKIQAPCRNIPMRSLYVLRWTLQFFAQKNLKTNQKQKVGCVRENVTSYDTTDRDCSGRGGKRALAFFGLLFTAFAHKTVQYKDRAQRGTRAKEKRWDCGIYFGPNGKMRIHRSGCKRSRPCHQRARRRFW